MSYADGGRVVNLPLGSPGTEKLRGLKTTPRVVCGTITSATYILSMQFRRVRTLSILVSMVLKVGLLPAGIMDSYIKFRLSLVSSLFTVFK